MRDRITKGLIVLGILFFFYNHGLKPIGHGARKVGHATYKVVV